MITSILISRLTLFDTAKRSKNSSGFGGSRQSYCSQAILKTRGRLPCVYLVAFSRDAQHIKKEDSGIYVGSVSAQRAQQYRTRRISARACTRALLRHVDATVREFNVRTLTLFVICIWAIDPVTLQRRSFSLKGDNRPVILCCPYRGAALEA